MDLDLYGSTYELKFPTQDMINRHGDIVNQALKGEIEITENKLIEAFLIESGLPEDVVLKTEHEHNKEIFQVLTNSKKS